VELARELGEVVVEGEDDLGGARDLSARFSVLISGDWSV
jgi:hypothetical protein